MNATRLSLSLFTDRISAWFPGGRWIESRGTRKSHAELYSAVDSSLLQSGSTALMKRDVAASRAWRLEPPSGTSGERDLPSSGPGHQGGSRSSLNSPHAPLGRAVLESFMNAWESGRSPSLEEYLDRIGPNDARAAIELIYQDFCHQESAGARPDPGEVLDRFPQYRDGLERIFRVHQEFSPSELGRWIDPKALAQLPAAGDSIGPYYLARELGRGSFAHVFLAEQTDLENRLVVVKVTSRPTREPWLLARARHANIVEIVSHAMVDDGDYQLICMPFWGGASLAAVLAEAARQPAPPASGRDLLGLLDQVAAPEYPAIRALRPARQILESLSYPRAVAWIMARLADALDHAYSREVAHGDVKPSNILLSADANPMLLDFNLARDGSRTGVDGSATDPGGTLAYMAPERRDSFNKRRLTSTPEREVDREQVRAVGSEMGPHLADLYSLGMVLLETITGVVPGAASPSAHPARDGSLNSATKSQAGGAPEGKKLERSSALIDAAEAESGRRIPPGLREIVERCLDPDPAARYARGWELSEDLERWRLDKPLVFTRERFWGYTLPRIVRRQWKKALWIAAALSFAIGLPITAWMWISDDRHDKSIVSAKLARHWDDADTREYFSQRPLNFRVVKPGDRQAIQVALHVLKDYGVIAADDNVRRGVDWREVAEVRSLPPDVQDDFQFWFLEQIYRFARGLEDRQNQKPDWRRALELLDQIQTATPVRAFEELGQRLRARLGAPEPMASKLPAQSTLPAGLARYLDGIAAECDASLIDPSSETFELDLETLATCPALEHYEAVLAIRPDSFWAHYRAAATLFRARRFDDAIVHLRECQKKRDNPVISSYLASCLWALGQLDEAKKECDRAIEGAPEWAELNRSRAFIRLAALHNQPTPDERDALSRDIERFEVLSHVLPRWALGRLPSFWDSGKSAEILGFPRVGTPTSVLATPHSAFGGDDDAPEVADDERHARIALAESIRKVGDVELSMHEVSKILILSPDDLESWVTHAHDAIQLRRFDVAIHDLETLLRNPRLMGHVGRYPQFFKLIMAAIRRLMHEGKVTELRTVIRAALDLAIKLNRQRSDIHFPRGELHYDLALAYGNSEPGDTRSVTTLARQLLCAFAANPFWREKYREDKAFDATRGAIDRAIDIEEARADASMDAKHR